MKRTNRFLNVSLGCALVFFLVSGAWAQIDMGDFTISGGGQVGGLAGHTGGVAKFEEYRDIPESIIVPQLQLMIGGKKEDFYLDFDGGKVGRDDQNYRLRFGRYGLLDIEFEWDSILHNFNLDNALSPYYRNGGNYQLLVRPTAANIADGTTTEANQFNTWLRANARPIDLRLLGKNAKIKVLYTPLPGWSFTGKYWLQDTDGKRAIAFPFGSGSSSNIAEVPEPINYQTHNLEFGGEYAGDGWSLGLKYNASLFHNDTSTLVLDNPAAAGPACVDAAAINYATGAGPCRGRVDLYPDNQAHTFTLTGATRLPYKTQFLGTVSYGWRLQDDNFLPFTINSAIANPTLSRQSLDGDVRPTMVNLTLVNNFVNNLNLKAYYRLYSLDSYTSQVQTSGTVRNDQSTGTSDWSAANPFNYSKNTAGLQTSYNFARWLTGKFNFNWDQMHRSIPQRTENNETVNTREVKIGPTFDIKPLPWLLFRTSYQRSWRDDPDYKGNGTREQFFLTQRNQDKVSLFTDISPWETLSFHAGFDYTSDGYPENHFGVDSLQNTSPSVGVLYAPSDWLRFFADYNFDLVDWKQKYSASIVSWGKDKVNTFSLGSDVDLIKNLLGFRIQYTFSAGLSDITTKQTTTPGVENPAWGPNANTWHELLARLEYRLHKNVGLQLGYYFNRYNSKDFGVDIMRTWMGNYDTNTGQLRSAYLGDRFKDGYTAHLGFVALRLSF